eukprot:9335163-Pyramimonas_sp.AAC.1
MLKTYLNAWNTTARYRLGTIPCRLGCDLLDGDNLRHYLCCPHFQQVVTGLLPLLPSSWASGDPAGFIIGVPRYLSFSELLSIAIAIDITYSTFNHVRVHGRCSHAMLSSLARARARAIAAATPAVRRALQGHQGPW